MHRINKLTAAAIASAVGGVAIALFPEFFSGPELNGAFMVLLNSAAVFFAPANKTI